MSLFNSKLVVIVPLLVIAVLVLHSRSHAASSHAPLATVPQVDLQRYMGVWYEIARIPHRFQEGCVASSTTYSLLPDGEVRVINRCRDERSGEQREATGRAWVVAPSSNARLKVSFFWPFRGDYWIIDLGDRYGAYAYIGETMTVMRWFRIELEAGVGIQGRYP